MLFLATLANTPSSRLQQRACTASVQHGPLCMLPLDAVFSVQGHLLCIEQLSTLGCNAPKTHAAAAFV
jgi:hypothetical protein